MPSPMLPNAPPTVHFQQLNPPYPTLSPLFILSSFNRNSRRFLNPPARLHAPPGLWLGCMLTAVFFLFCSRSFKLHNKVKKLISSFHSFVPDFPSGIYSIVPFPFNLFF